MENKTDKKPTTGRKMCDLSGKKFGRLTALYPTARRDRKGSVYWHCICDCGNEFEATEDGLLFENNRSYGCLKRELQAGINDRLHRVEGTCLEWLEKRKHRKDNTSGFRGITYMKQRGKYRVSIGFQGKRFYLGSYSNIDDAIRIRLQAEEDIHNTFLKMYREWDRKASEDPEWGKENPFVFRVEKDKTHFYRVITDRTIQ